MIKAKEIMTTPVVSVTEDNTLQDVIELLAKHRFSGLPVVDRENMLKGIISDTDIVRYSQKISIVPKADLSGWISPYADVSDLVTIQRGRDVLHNATVGEVMTGKAYTAKEDDPVNVVSRLMNRRRINRVPIVDSKGKLVGIITRADIVQCMAKLEIDNARG